MPAEPKQEFKQSTTVSTGRPLQRLSWSEKTQDKRAWFKNNVEYYISLSNFNFDGTGSNRKDLRLLYQAYNAQFPRNWFTHITDPLSAKDSRHRNFPAKLRPVSILRTNIDLLLGEYPKRPFIYQVENLGEDGYNHYTQGLADAVHQNCQMHFAATVIQGMQAQGTPAEELPGMDEIELPESLTERFNTTYKDAEAIKGQRWLKRAMGEYKLKDTFLRQFKHWLISGRTCSYKGIRHGTMVYEDISPLHLDYDKSPDTTYIEDGEWVVCRRLFTISDIVDWFYDQLDDDQLTDLESRTQYSSPFAFYNFLQETSDKNNYMGKIPVYHVCWKGKKKIGFLTYPDPITGETQELVVDEDYIVNTEIGEKVEWRWVNEVYEGYRIGDHIFTTLDAVPCQRSEMNNYSACKLPYNGRSYSDLHSENISVLEMGLPFQQMYIIINYILEKTIAKSKGKIILVDKNAMPRGQGWDDEKFFYYAEALGYMLVDRNQAGVDKSLNQYQVLDMSLFDQIKQLIELKNNYKQEWDDLIGINRPRKGETYASDGKGVSEMGLMQSSVITDMIFEYFEQYTEREMQGILDLSKFVNVKGVKALYNNEDFDLELLEIDPTTYCHAELGIVTSRAAEAQQTLNSLKSSQNIPAMIQAGVKPSTILGILQSKNVAELKMQLKKVEELEAQIEQQQAKNEQEMAKEADARKERYRQFEHNLEVDLQDRDWDRRDNNEIIKGEFQEAAFAKTDDVNNNGLPDANEIEKRNLERQKMVLNHQVDMKSLDVQQSEGRETRRVERDKMATDERIADKKHKTEITKARISKKNKPKT